MRTIIVFLCLFIGVQSFSDKPAIVDGKKAVRVTNGSGCPIKFVYVTDSAIVSKISIFGSSSASIIINNPVSSVDSSALGSFINTTEVSILLGLPATHPAFRFQVLCNDSVRTCSNISANAKVPLLKYTSGLCCNGIYTIKVESSGLCQ